MRFLRELLTREDGVTSVEYAVLLALIVGTTIATIKAVGDQTSGIWAGNKQQLDDAGF